MSEILAHLILEKSIEHFQLWFFSILIATFLSLIIGIALAKSKKRAFCEFMMSLISSFQTIPGIAFIALIEVMILNLRPHVILPTTGLFPGVLALVFYALLPIVKNTTFAIKKIPKETFELGLVVGMKKRHLFYYIELPLSLPLILSGIRIASVSTFGLVTLTSIIGSGGLGDLIFQGLRRFQVDYVIAGTLPIILMAILVDFSFIGIEKWLFSKHSRSKQKANQDINHNAKILS